jgi:hypothetical protein
MGASTAGLGKILLGRSPALQVVTPANISVKMRAERREKNFDITDSLATPANEFRSSQ